MPEQTRLAPWLRRFLAEYIVTERNLAANTRHSYRDTFRILLPFIADLRSKPRRGARTAIDRLAIDDLSADRLRQFLDHLEEARGCSVQTRNQRLAAIRAFARFVGSREPALIDWCAQIRAIPVKKAQATPVTWLTRAEMQCLLDVANADTVQGRNKHALLLFMYNTGARVSEVAGLVVGDLEIGDRRRGDHALVTFRGKGGKIRRCPLWSCTEKLLVEMLKGRDNAAPVFLSQQGRAYTRTGILRLVQRQAARIPSLANRKITPHTLRHSCGTHLLQAGVDINTIRAWLGHASLNTTNIYVQIDLEMKAKAMALCEAGMVTPNRGWKQEHGLMAFLNAL